MRHAVLGAGGVGGLVGGVLAKAGHPVTLLVRPGRRDLYPERPSVQSETFGNFERPVRVADRLDEGFDVFWITVKAMALEPALGAIPLGDGVVVPLLRDCYGAERVLPEAVQVEAEQMGPVRVRYLSAFAGMQVALHPATRARAEALSEELRDSGLGCEVQDDETTMLWSKLCFLAPFALATTALEGSLGVVRADAGRWATLEECGYEACAILEAKNERTANFYLDGSLDTDEHRRLETDRGRAELYLQHARREVERLHLIVRLLGTLASEGIQR